MAVQGLDHLFMSGYPFKYAGSAANVRTIFFQSCDKNADNNIQCNKLY